jgi:hypothetical protein
MSLQCQVCADLGLPEFSTAADAEAHAVELLRLYQTVQWLAEGADPKDRGAGDLLVTLAADALMASRHLQPDRAAVTRRLLQARSKRPLASCQGRAPDGDCAAMSCDPTNH